MANTSCLFKKKTVLKKSWVGTFPASDDLLMSILLSDLLNKYFVDQQGEI